MATMLQLPSGVSTILARQSSWYTGFIIETLPGYEEGGDTAERRILFQQFEHVFDPEYAELLEWLGKRAADELGGVELEKLQAPLLEHVGIVDINRCFQVLSPDLKSDIVYAYSLSGSAPINDVRLELEEQLFKRLGVSRGGIHSPARQGNSPDDFWNFEKLQNELYSIIEGGLVDDIANTALWRRTLGIPQLGWKDNYPVENIHSRGAHERFLTINTARVLQSLYRKCLDELVARLRRDFVGMDFYDESMSSDAVAKLGMELAIVVNMTHDIYSPAGGDMMKHVMGMDEEADASKLLEDGDERVDELRRVLEKRGIKRGHLEFAVNCIQGSSGSLVGEMIHAQYGDCLDQDRIAYTFQDSYSIGILSPALPDILLNENSLKNSTEAIQAAIENVVNLLNNPYMYAVGPAYIGGQPVSMSVLDISNDYVIDDSLRLVCTSPEKATVIAYIRVMLMGEFYQGTKLRGQEHDMNLLLNDARNSQGASNILNVHNLLSVNNRELEQQLRDLGDVALGGILDKMSKIFFDTKYKSRIEGINTSTEDGWMELVFSIKAGLDTLAMDDSEVTTLREYTVNNVDETFSRLLLEAIEFYNDKKRVIDRIDDRNEHVQDSWIIV